MFRREFLFASFVLPFWKIFENVALKIPGEDGEVKTNTKFFSAIIIPCLVAWYSQSAIAQSGDAPFTFNTTGSLNTARLNHTATLLPNGSVVVAGASHGISNALASAELYDPASGTWAATGSLNAGRALHTATLLLSGNVLVIGGRSNGISNGLASAELYDPASGTWATTGSLNAGRYGHTTTLLPNGKVLGAGGHNGSA